MSHNTKVTGALLYYARAVDPTVLMPLNDIATEQTKATEKTQATTNQMLDYLATHPDTTVRYHASDMVLHIHSDASYLSVSNARNRLGGLFFLGNKSPEQDALNGSILNVAAVIKNVVASAAESEVGACFNNAQSGAPLRVTLTKLGHTQPPTPLRTDNYTAYGIINETIKQKRSKAMDMRYNWLTDRVRQKQFDIYWRPGRENLADYHTKLHSAQHHKDMRHLILHEANSLQVMRGCVKLLPLPQPPVLARTDARTNPSAQKATQLRSVLTRVHTVSIQNQITTTVP
jgi:3-phenylpropionate/cinnamic acid dioxygenase small subunit